MGAALSHFVPHVTIKMQRLYRKKLILNSDMINKFNERPPKGVTEQNEV